MRLQRIWIQLLFIGIVFGLRPKIFMPKCINLRNKLKTISISSYLRYEGTKRELTKMQLHR
jgi:hypothetical protein